MTLPVLYRGFFQLGYVVHSLDGAMHTLRQRMGVTRWEVRELSAAAPAQRLGFAYVDELMIELVDIRPEEDTIYRAWRPESDEALRLHHLGYMIDSEAEWRDTLAHCEAAGFGVASAGEIPGKMDWHYADTVALLGHYCELIRYTSEAGKAYWANVPHN
jgi:hypothetical protein